jgi:hypothetical protein
MNVQAGADRLPPRLSAPSPVRPSGVNGRLTLSPGNDATLGLVLCPHLPTSWGRDARRRGRSVRSRDKGQALYWLTHPHRPKGDGDGGGDSPSPDLLATDPAAGGDIAPFGYDLGAMRPADRTSRMEPATGGRIARAWHIAGQDDPLTCALFPRIESRPTRPG